MVFVVLFFVAAIVWLVSFIGTCVYLAKYDMERMYKWFTCMWVSMITIVCFSLIIHFFA